MKPTVYVDTTIPSYYVDEQPALRLHLDRTRRYPRINAIVDAYLAHRLMPRRGIRDALHRSGWARRAS